MENLLKTIITASAICLPFTAMAEEAKTPVPSEILKIETAGMPVGPQQEIRVLKADVGPGKTTVHHTHRFPVTTYVLSGAMTFEIEGQEPIAVKAGDAFVEPANTPVTGTNTSPTDKAQVVIFYVSEPSTPFLDVIK